MKGVMVMRTLRHRYGITIRELAEAVGVSHQYVSDLELGKYTGRYDFRHSGIPLMQAAFERVVDNKAEQARRLSEDYGKYRHSLLDFVEVNNEL